MKVNITLLPVPKKYGMMESPQIDMAQLYGDLSTISDTEVTLFDGRNFFAKDDTDIENLFENLVNYASYFESIYDRSILTDPRAQVFFETMDSLVGQQDVYVIPFSVLEQFRIEYIIPALCFIIFLCEKYPNVQVIIFGNYSYKYAKVFQEKFDFVDAIVLHADNISLKNYLSQKETKNIIFKDKDGTFKEGEQDYSVQIHEFVTPNFDGFDLEFYSRKGTLVLPYELSRWCKNSCFFCYYIHKGWTVYKKEISKIVSDMKDLKNKYKTDRFHFHDAEVNADIDFLSDLCREMISSQVSIYWSALAIPYNLDKDTIQLLYDAGCRQLRFGVESGSQEILDIIGKWTKVESIEDILKCCREVGISTYVTLITDIPQEKVKHVTETANFLIRNHKHISDLQMCFYGELWNFPIEYLRKHTFPESLDKMSSRKMFFESLQRKLGITKGDIVEFIRSA